MNDKLLMQQNYKLILRSSRTYREITLSSQTTRMSIGTTVGSDVRFQASDFFQPFQIQLQNDSGIWTVMCDSNVYLSAGDVRKLLMADLSVASPIMLRYSQSDTDVMELRLTYDFGDRKKYDLFLDLQTLPMIRIDASGSAQIQTSGSFTKEDSVELKKQNKEWALTVLSEDCGTEVNGMRIRTSVKLQEMDFIDIGPYSFCYADGGLYTCKASDLTVHGLSESDCAESKTHLEYPKFNRGTRIMGILPEDKIEVLDPPAMPPESNKDIVTQLLPSVAMMGILVMLRGTSTVAGGTSFIMMSVASMGISVGVSVYSIIKDMHDRDKKLRERSSSYEEYITAKRNEIREYRKQEAELLEEKYNPQSENLDRIRSFDGSLFDRSCGDDDFLEVRLGIGLRRSVRDVKYKDQERVEAGDKLQQIPAKVEREFKNLSDAPITLPLKETSLVGIVGERESLAQMLKLISLDLASRHYESDVKLFYCIEEDDIERFSWIRRLPHVQNDIIGCRNIICDDASRNILLEYLYKLISNRDEKNTEPRLIVFLYRDWGIRNHPVSRLMEIGKYLGITFLYFDEYEENLPHCCEYIIRMKTPYQGICLKSSDKTSQMEFTSEALQDEDMEYAAHRLQPVFCEEVSLESALTSKISFFELLNIYEPEDIDLSRNWTQSQVYQDMAVPLGVKSKDQIVYLDIHEKAHGPHGLVAGTTGSGKSEVLQSYILSMALKYHPYDVGFVLIDFKGGGMAGQFQTLPHLIGTMTNIDGKEIDRSLMSIRAELKRRQELFAQYNVNHIDAYIKLYKKGEAVTPLPHLILIVDEFAELKAEHPDFMKELVSAARIGRSLGVHLILATQKPSGVVDPQIWSNSRFKLCLKVQSKEDSNEVLKSPVAAEIKEPGRAYLQVGNNEIFELFQSGYSGGPAKIEGLTVQKSFRISRLDFSGRRKVVFERKASKKLESEETQLQSIIRYIAEYTDKTGLERLPMICLPPLPERIEYPEGEALNSEIITETAGGLTAEIGIYDDPARQYQGSLSINVTQDNTIIIGSAQYGKTNLLQTIIRSLTEKYSPSQLNLYIMDFGSMILRSFEKLHHVGGVVCANEDEKVKNLFKLLNSEIQIRRKKLSDHGVGSYASYLEAGLQGIPQIVVMIDNLTALRELYMQENDMVLPLCREGLGVGISFIIANPQTSGISFRYLTNFGRRIALFCNDNSEYNALFGISRMIPSKYPGRCLIELDKTIYEAQTFVSFEGEKEIERVTAINEFIHRSNRRFYERAVMIPMVPDNVNKRVLKDVYHVYTSDEQIVIGVDYETIEPVILKTTEYGYLGMTGSMEQQKLRFVRYLFEIFNMCDYRVYVVDDLKGTLSYSQYMDCTELYLRGCDRLKDLMTEIREYLNDRKQRMNIDLTDSQMVDRTPVILVIHSEDAVEAISKDKEMLVNYKSILSDATKLRAMVIFTALDNIAISYQDHEVRRMMRNERNFLLFEDIPNVRIVDNIPPSIIRRNSVPLKEGEAYLFNEALLHRVKLADPEEPDKPETVINKV